MFSQMCLLRDGKLPDLPTTLVGHFHAWCKGLVSSLAELRWVHHRAYKLHQGTPHAIMTAADVAVAYDELARAIKRATPSGKASSAAVRAERAAEGVHHTWITYHSFRHYLLRQLLGRASVMLVR